MYLHQLISGNSSKFVANIWIFSLNFLRNHLLHGNPLSQKQSWPLTSAPQTSNTLDSACDNSRYPPCDRCPEEKAWDHLRGDSQTIVMFVCGIIGLIVMIIISSIANCFACCKTSPKNNQYRMVYGKSGFMSKKVI